jgi:hypothetical protein
LYLTSLEQSLLYLLAANAGRVVTREEVMDTLWGVDYVAQSNIVDRLIRNLRARSLASHPTTGIGSQVAAGPSVVVRCLTAALIYCGRRLRLGSGVSVAGQLFPVLSAARRADATDGLPERPVARS